MKQAYQLRIGLIAAITALCILAGTNENLAAGRRGFLGRNTLFAGRKARSYYETYHCLNRRYPKYYGGFHARYFQDLGMSPGDIGLRGNGIYPTPW